jgi:hypothetical protein
VRNYPALFSRRTADLGYPNGLFQNDRATGPTSSTHLLAAPERAIAGYGLQAARGSTSNVESALREYK